MQARLISLIGILILVVLVLPAHAQHRTRHVVRKQLDAKYAAQIEAYRNRDIKAFMENKTPDFTLKTLNGKVSSREQMEAGVKQRMERIQRLNYLRIKIRKLTVTGDIAVAITTKLIGRLRWLLFHLKPHFRHYQRFELWVGTKAWAAAQQALGADSP